TIPAAETFFGLQGRAEDRRGAAIEAAFSARSGRCFVRLNRNRDRRNNAPAAKKSRSLAEEHRTQTVTQRQAALPAANGLLPCAAGAYFGVVRGRMVGLGPRPGRLPMQRILLASFMMLAAVPVTAAQSAAQAPDQGINHYRPQKFNPALATQSTLLTFQ